MKNQNWWSFVAFLTFLCLVVIVCGSVADWFFVSLYLRSADELQLFTVQEVRECQEQVTRGKVFVQLPVHYMDLKGRKGCITIRQVEADWFEWKKGDFVYVWYNGLRSRYEVEKK